MQTAELMKIRLLNQQRAPYLFYSLSKFACSISSYFRVNAVLCSRCNLLAEQKLEKPIISFKLFVDTAFCSLLTLQGSVMKIHFVILESSGFFKFNVSSCEVVGIMN